MEIITALDFDNINKAKELVNKVGSNISYYKVGLELFVSSGPAIIDWLKSENKKVFLHQLIMVLQYFFCCIHFVVLPHISASSACHLVCGY